MSSDDNLTRLEALLAEQAALRRVATMVAGDTPAPALFGRVCEELGELLAVKSTDMIRFEDESFATVVGSWTGNDTPSFPVGERIPVEGESVTAKLYQSGRPERVDDYDDVESELAERIREFGIHSVVGAPSMWPVACGARSWCRASSRTRSRRGPRRGSAASPSWSPRRSPNVDAREQLAASRARIVEAADAARRRIERDLHDGAQQRLVSLALSLQRLESSLEPNSAATHELAVARAELDAALEELRELARGIHPSILTDRGLEAALAAVAGRSTVPVELDLDGCRELPLSVQTTAYFVVVEALTNASKHAHSDRIEVRVAVGEETAMVEVRDDGSGGVDPAQGSGLSGLADRVSALGGTLEVDSPVGAGTTIRARIPARMSDTRTRDVGGKQSRHLSGSTRGSPTSGTGAGRP